MLTILIIVIYSILSAYELLFFVRAICSWVPYFRDSRVYEFSYKLTEPILRPVRDAMFRIDWIRRCPIDLSFLVVVILLSAVSNLLLFFI